MRKKDWSEKLVNYLLDNLDTPFEWGTFDCCLFAANAVREMTGKDFAAPFRDKYTTEKGAAPSRGEADSRRRRCPGHVGAGVHSPRRRARKGG